MHQLAITDNRQWPHDAFSPDPSGPPCYPVPSPNAWDCQIGLSDNIVLKIITIKSQYWNHDISESESCNASHVFTLQRRQKAISSFYLLKMAIVLYEAILDSQHAMGRFWSQTERNVSLCTVYCKLFLIKQLS